MNNSTPPRRRPTNVSLDPRLVEEAKALRVNLSRACEAGLAAELKAAREKRWLEENGESIRQWNQWVAKNELPLARYRQF